MLSQFEKLHEKIGEKLFNTIQKIRSKTKTKQNNILLRTQLSRFNLISVQGYGKFNRNFNLSLITSRGEGLAGKMIPLVEKLSNQMPSRPLY